jgi:phage-related baseplate assembly protein
MGDRLTVAPARVWSYRIRARLTLAGEPDSAVVLDASRAAAAAYAVQRHRLGAELPLSGIYAALHQPGVEAVELLEPTVDLTPTLREATWCEGVDVELEGTP